MNKKTAFSFQPSAIRKINIHPVYCVLLTVCYLLLLTGCTKQDNMYKESRTLMDTYCTITVVSPSKEKAKKAIDAGFAEIKKLDKFLNNFEADSEISAISRDA